MEQLIMRWQNDGKPEVFPTLPDGVSIERFDNVENALDEWLDIIQYGLSEKREDEEFYKRCNYRYEYYTPQTCYFFMLDGKAVATVTVICDPVKKDGYIHMVGAKPEARGRGIGNAMSLFAVYLLKKNGMQTAHLTTDDWRIPAIKTYLKGGLTADLGTDDFKERWAKIFEIINKK